MSDDETLFNFGYGATYTTFNFSFATSSGGAGVPLTVGVAVFTCVPIGCVVGTVFVTVVCYATTVLHRAHSDSYYNWQRDSFFCSGGGDVEVVVVVRCVCVCVCVCVFWEVVLFFTYALTCCTVSTSRSPTGVHAIRVL